MATVEAANIPPNTVNPMVRRATAPAPVANTNGNTPNINASEVMMMGRKRRLTASRVDLMRSSPLSTRTLANSTIRMAFLAAKPISVIKPICAYTLFVRLGTNTSARIAPKAPIGTARSTENGTDQLSYKCCKEQEHKGYGEHENVDGS